MLFPKREFPPIDPRPWLSRLKVVPDRTTTVLCLSAELLVFHLHYDGTRQVPCPLPLQRCKYHEQGSLARWEAFLAVLPVASIKPQIAGITRGSYEHSRSLQESNGRLRGMELVFKRIGKTVKSGLSVEVRPVETPSLRMRNPPSVNLIAALCRWWGISTIELVEAQENDVSQDFPPEREE